jgi:hypothetical protein
MQALPRLVPDPAALLEGWPAAPRVHHGDADWARSLLSRDDIRTLLARPGFSASRIRMSQDNAILDPSAYADGVDARLDAGASLLVTGLQAAQTERRRYQQRGGERLPGARGGVFQQKITDAERVLATVLYQRKACTRQVLADLFQVSPRTIGNALIEVRPLLDQDGYDPPPAASRFRSATALLNSLTPPPDVLDTTKPPC